MYETFTYPDIANWHFTLDIIATDTTYNIQNSSNLYSMAYGVVAEEMCYWGTTPRRYQTCRRQTLRSTNETRKEGLKCYADMTIYTTNPAKLVPKICHHKLLQLL